MRALSDASLTNQELVSPCRRMDTFVVVISIAGLLNDSIPAVNVLRLVRVFKMVYTEGEDDTRVHVSGREGGRAQTRRGAGWCETVAGWGGERGQRREAGVGGRYTCNAWSAAVGRA